MKRRIYQIAANCLILISCSLKSQVLAEHFNTGIPAGWTQNPANSWSVHPSFGVSGSPCIITEGPNSNTLTASVKTATVNLTGITSPTVYFKAAIIKNNFLSGNIVLWYDQGTGPQFVARWGGGFTANTTDTIPEDGFDPAPPLDADQVSWHAHSKKITPTSNTISLIFDAEFINGGYMLLDSIMVAGTTVTVSTVGLKEINAENAVTIFPNPATDKKLMIYASDLKELRMSDQLGKNMKVSMTQKNENSFELDASGVAPGIYYLNLRFSDNKIVRKKLVID